MVQEPGWSSLRVAAHASLTLERTTSCEVKLHTRVTSIERDEANDEWELTYSTINKNKNNSEKEVGKIRVGQLINCCGYQTGQIDDMVGIKQ